MLKTKLLKPREKSKVDLKRQAGSYDIVFF